MKEYFINRYSGAPMIALGFHGCAQSVARKVLYKQEELKDSTNEFDWLGTGKYFWEANPQRAMEWARQKYSNSSDSPAVVGACIDLTSCLNLIETSGLLKLKTAYNLLKKAADTVGYSLPQNIMNKNVSERLLRKLDCLVVNVACKIHEKIDPKPYTSVRGVFWEGADLYDTAGFKEKNHIQICVRDPKAILCYFHPKCFPTS